ncbi:hypothetical protein KUTeg_003069 [Tegillarca granosa]|uniref:Methionine aminopeptidase n=1 Tax=Tegillarca granosa TaxID=220873 RepID=A0ABQ9FL22_TEGGR|nr:hypothetical protein KUTeg_003069 [Tegillarca granosa]
MAAVVESRICETSGCSNDAKLQCPTCIKLGIPGSFFCTQDCFKGFWNEHKKLHKKAKEDDKVKDPNAYNPWPGFKFTGQLRPFQVVSVPLSERQMRGSTNIKILDDEEQEAMRVACKATIDRECYPSPLNYYQFPKSCCTSVNEVICHGIPDKRPLQDGDIMNIDVTVYHRGYHGDLNETFFVGNVDEGSKKLVKTTYECLKNAIDEVKPGVRYREMGNIIQKHAQAHGYSVVRSYCGHGIHSLFHTAPSVPHYSKNKAVGVMKPGHTFTIEPMISEGTWRDEMWPDNWTAVTQDGKRSAQFEHTLLVTDTGCEILTRRFSHDGQPHFMDQM